MPQSVDRFRWQQAILSEDGPTNATARLILMAISMHMNTHGENAWPSQTTIARRALVCRRSVVKHLEAAERQGWISRYDAGHNGQGWRLSGYVAMVPDAVYDALPERPWEKDPQWTRSQRGESIAPAIAAGGPVPPPSCSKQPGRGESDPVNVANGATKRCESGAKGGEPGAHKSSLLNLPYKSSLRGEGTLSRTDRRKKFSEKEIKDRIRTLGAAGFGVGDICKQLSQFGITAEQVRQEGIGAVNTPSLDATPIVHFVALDHDQPQAAVAATDELEPLRGVYG